MRGFSPAKQTRHPADEVPDVVPGRSFLVRVQISAASLKGRRRGIQQQPVHMQAPDGSNELREVNRFLDVTIRPMIVGGHNLGLACGSCEHHHGDEPQSRILFNPLEHFYPVNAGQFQVQEDEARSRRGGPGLRILRPERDSPALPLRW